jgi:hypothetical protein
MHHPLLGILSGQPHILVKIEGPDAPAVDPTFIGRLCEAFTCRWGNFQWPAPARSPFWVRDNSSSLLVTICAATWLMCSKSLVTSTLMGIFTIQC